MMLRTAFYVDGYNLYHSLRDSERTLRITGARWLDLMAFCRSFLSLIDRGAVLESVTYFSAIARHREAESPGTSTRHGAYLDALLSSGVLVELGHFKRKSFRCSACSARAQAHEEKETDVAIAARLIERFHQDACDVAVLVTGDSDLAPAIRTAARMFPAKRALVCFPFARKSEELRQVASGHFKVSSAHCFKHQFPDPILTSSGRAIAKPEGW